MPRSRGRQSEPGRRPYRNDSFVVIDTGQGAATHGARYGADAKILTSPGDNAFRWRHGERLEDLFEDHCDALRRAGRGGDLAVDGPAGG